MHPDGKPDFFARRYGVKAVFVSSTFKDMQFERDLLQTYAVPTLNGRLREYGERVYFGDLRWGVNTTDLDSEEGSRKVLRVCLDQIDGCKPYMIVLIGERYGWIPAQTLIDEACVLKGIDKIDGISVTELEIDYGALLAPEYEGRILFYFRNLDKSGMSAVERRDYEAESDLHLQKVELLKRRIEALYPDHIRYYDAAWDARTKRVTGLEGFLERVQADLAEVLLRDLERESSLPWQERSMRAARRYFEQVNKTLVSVENAALAYVGSRAENGATFVYVTGEEGSGKSAAVIRRFCSDGGERLAFSLGLDRFSRSAFDFSRILIYKLEELLGRAHGEYADEAPEDALLDLLAALDVPLGIYIDGADGGFLQFLSRLEATLCDADEPWETRAFFMIAVQRELPFYPFFDRSAKLVTEELSEKDRASVLDGIVGSHRKELSDAVKARILSKKSSGSAAYLKSVVKRLMILDSEDFAAIRAMGDGMDSINRYMISIVDATADDRYGILGELIGEAKERIDRTFVERLTGLFLHVPVGLDAGEIRGIFAAYGWEFNDLDFSLTVQMLEDVLDYYPDTRFYRIRNEVVEHGVFDVDTVWDPLPAVEYMLGEGELAPYALRAAVADAEIDDLCAVLKRSGITDITDSIRYLVERGLQERAIGLLLAIAENEEFRSVRLLPSFRELQPTKHRAFYEFLGTLAAACDGRLTEDTLLLLEMDLEARFAVAEYALDVDPRITVNMLIEADGLLRRYARRADVTVINRMYLLMLRAINKTKSKELFDEYIGGESYLRVFRYADGDEGTALKMRVYTEYSEIVGTFDGETEALYREQAEVLASDVNIADCGREALVCVARLTHDPVPLILGRAIDPFDTELLRAEVALALEDGQADLRDTMEKALALWDFTDTLFDCVTYWRSILYCFLREEDADGELAETYVSLTAYLNGRVLCAADYADLLPFALALDDAEDVERLLAAAENDGELESFVQRMIRCYCLEDDRAGLLALRKEFLKIRDAHMGADRVATAMIGEYLDLLTKEI